jgi:uncharacterized protein (TIGR03435 family)
MFDRFTVGATRILFHARVQASELGSAAIEPEHLLLGLLEERTGLASRILASAGDDRKVRGDIRARVADRDSVPASTDLPFSDACKRAISGAVEEADRMQDAAVGTEHLLLGLMRGEGTVATEVLSARGVTLEGVREAIREFRREEEPEPPGPPPTPANTYPWPRIPFVPSRTVHILYSGMQWPTQPVINFPGTAFCAYGFTLQEMIVRAWQGSPWHVDITPGLETGVRFDFLMALPQEETWDTCLGLLQSAIEQQFGVRVSRETRMRDVYRLTDIGRRGPMLRRYPDPPPGTAFSSLRLPVFLKRSPDAPMFPLEPFAAHSMPWPVLVSWFEESLGRQVIDETGLPGIYGFELSERVNSPEAFIQRLRDEAGLAITPETRELPTLIVRPGPRREH